MSGAAIVKGMATTFAYLNGIAAPH